MQVIEIAGTGGPETLQLAERPNPEPGPGEVLVKVAAAGVNMPDVFQRRGGYPPPPGVTDIPGLEVAGTVVALGEGVDDIAEGDAVCALLAGGGYAEYAVAPRETVLPVPRGLELFEAAAIPETFFTVWDALFMRARLGEGQSVLIHGGAGGIGTTALQLARASGCAKIFTTARLAPGQEALCLECGADRVIDYNSEDFVEVVKDATDGRGVDVVLDIIGGDYVNRNLEALALEGRLFNLNFVKGIEVKVNFRPVMLKRLSLMASTLRARTPAQKGLIAGELRDRVWPWFEAGKIRPRVARRLPLASAGEAQAILEAGGHSGKVVLEI